MKITKPDNSVVPEFYRDYISKCDEEDLIESLTKGLKEINETIEAIKSDKENYRYAEGKWNVKEVISHMIDGERVFSYRALRFSRMDDTPLAGFDENHYVPNSNAGTRTISSLKKEFEALRLSNIEMFEGMTEEMLNFEATANGNIMTACSLGWSMAGHAKHHCSVLKQKYLK